MGYITKICPGLANHLTILRQIVVGNGAAACRNCFAVTDTGNIIGVLTPGLSWVIKNPAREESKPKLHNILGGKELWNGSAISVSAF